MDRVEWPLRRQARTPSNAPAVIDGDVTLGYEQLAVRVRALAERLRTRGVQPGDVVATQLPRSMQHLALLWALWQIGAIAAPLSTRLPWAGTVERLQDLQASFLAAQDIPAERLPSFTTLLDGQAPEAASLQTEQAAQLHRPTTLVYTSGSTGQPKAALHSFGNHYYSAVGSNENIPLQQGDRWLLTLPVYHVGGLAVLFRCALSGAAVVIPQQERSIAAHLEDGITHLSLVATQLHRLIEKKTTPPSHVKAVLVGGGPLPSGLIKRAHEAGWPLHTSYGLTEMSSQVTTTPTGSSLADLRTAGYSLAHREVKISDSGEILVRGRTRFQGYYREGEVTEPFQPDGWYATGDLGRWDAEGRLVVTGRKDNLLISGGENIQPEEIEQALASQPGVKEAVVVGVPSDTYGERPVAFVALQPEGCLLDEVQARLREQLPSFKVPDVFFKWPDSDEHRLKPDRQRLQRLAAQQLGLQERRNG